MPVRAPTRTVKSDVVPLKNVDEELARRIRAIEGLGKGPVLRACMSNLVVFCDSPELAERIEGQMPAIVAAHPARVLLLVSDPAADKGVTAQVSVQGRITGDGHWVCTEQVVLRASATYSDRLPYCIRPLLVGD